MKSDKKDKKNKKHKKETTGIKKKEKNESKIYNKKAPINHTKTMQISENVSIENKRKILKEKHKKKIIKQKLIMY